MEGTEILAIAKFVVFALCCLVLTLYAMYEIRRVANSYLSDDDDDGDDPEPDDEPPALPQRSDDWVLRN